MTGVATSRGPLRLERLRRSADERRAARALLDGPVRWRVAVRIAGFLVRRARRSIFAYLACAAAPAILLTAVADVIPLLHRDDAWIGVSIYPLCGMAMVLQNAAAIRARRDATGTRGVPSSAATVAMSLVISSLWYAGLAGAVAGAEVVLLKVLGGVGSPAPLEILTVVPAVFAAGGLGVAVAYLFPSRLVAFVAVAGLITLHVVLGLGYVAKWFGLLAAPEFAPLPREVVARPVGAHLVYLAGLAMAFGAFALLRAGAGERRLLAAVTALGVIAAGAISTVEGLGHTRASTIAARPRACRTIDRVSVCVHPGYEGYLDLAEPIVRRTLVRVPAAARPAMTIEQDLGALGVWLSYSDLGFGSAWSRHGEQDLMLGLSVGVRAVGFPLGVATYPTRAARGAAGSIAHPMPTRCYAYDEARAVVALWLAMQASREARTQLLREASWHPGPSVYGSKRRPRLYYVPWALGLGNARGTWLGSAELAVALALERRDNAALMVTKHWEVLTDPRTTTQEAESILGLRLATFGEQLVNRGLSGRWLERFEARDGRRATPHCRDLQRTG
ncbi:MAG TPA: hypothetical protein VGB83_01740 [Actinomycetota bacterium]